MHPDARAALCAWHSEAEDADWRNPVDVKRRYASVSVLRGGRVVFNICGNKYRLVAWINYSFHVLYIRFIGTHEEYDHIDVETI